MIAVESVPLHRLWVVTVVGQCLASAVLTPKGMRKTVRQQRRLARVAPVQSQTWHKGLWMLQGPILLNESAKQRVEESRPLSGLAVRELEQTHPRPSMITAFRSGQASQILKQKSRHFVTVIPKPLNRKEL